MHVNKKPLKIIEQKLCRVSKQKLREVFSLGNLPHSCFPLPEDPELERYPLKLAFNEQSSLLQLCHTVDPSILYSQYWYMSGINDSMTQALKSIVDQALQRVPSLQSGDIVVDIGCNDGTLLNAYPEFLFKVGIDPAQNIKPKNCNLHINARFDKEIFQNCLGDKKAKIITSIAMFYDLEDPVQFVKDIASIMSLDGLWIIELSYLPCMLCNNAFDAICAEHLEYYSIESLDKILSKAHLKIEDAELNAVNGGSIRVYVRHSSACNQEKKGITDLRSEEKRFKLEELSTYINFQNRIEANKVEMLDFLKTQKALGKKVIGYGASTKGNTIMAYYGIGPDLLSHVADRNPIKWGRQTVTRIPIISEVEARNMQPDYFLVFPYHFIKEFLKREKAFLASGGQFVSPIPHLTFYS